ncbi:MAG: hypothetical protein BGO98_26305 [Myxococcales bacterium 68-20]|nr:flagellar basal body-associated FliL family protein [Myxococcales bacterium]OJY30251.1 MAG: hypothetical protein BGO98_26305 [Myxococcales bacterium 68-20]
MTENKTNAPAPDAPSPTPPKPSPIGGLFRVVVPALLAAGAAYGGTRAAAARTSAAGGPQASAEHATVSRPPGPTLPLDPFLATLVDTNKKTHPMKMSIAIEFGVGTVDDLKPFVPRIRDAVLAYLRTVTHEQVTDPAQLEKIRADLLERCRSVGALTAERVLVTDFVVQ